jgi:hypothetical protein
LEKLAMNNIKLCVTSLIFFLCFGISTSNAALSIITSINNNPMVFDSNTNTYWTLDTADEGDYWGPPVSE